MIFKNIKPVTPSQRHLIQLNKKHLNKKPILKNKISGLKNSSGRNNSGKITVYHKGSGVKQRYRKINFHRTNNSSGIVCSIEHDPNRNAFISAVFDFITGTFFYIITPQNIRVGDIVKSGLEIEPSLGSSLPVSEIPAGIPIHNISPKFFEKAKIARSAGTFAIIQEKKDKSVLIELSSGEQRFISDKCFATIGKVSNEFNFLTQSGKAGHSRWLNKRPTVRGVAMNPIDHPHGGGEGKKSGKNRTPWGKNNTKGSTSNSRNRLIFKKKQK
jgi:large subunit ribosomal protein L2